MESGFSVAKTADLILVAEKLKDKSNAGQTAQEKSVVNVTVANIRFLSLSNDELTVAVCSGGSVMFYDLPSLVLKVRVNKVTFLISAVCVNRT